MAEVRAAAVEITGLVLRSWHALAGVVYQTGVERGLPVPVWGSLLGVERGGRGIALAAQLSRRDVAQPVARAGAQLGLFRLGQRVEQPGGLKDITRRWCT